MLNIKKQLAPVIPLSNCYGYGNKKKFLTIHQTGNSNVGANAQVHANLQSRVYGASWHWTVDDKEAIQSFEHSVSCWHASDGRNDGNLNSIAIEGCINSDGNYLKAVTNMAELAAKIMKDEGIPIENMKQHHDFDIKHRKNCPAQIRAGKGGIDWNDFVNMVKGFMKDEPVIAVKSVSVEKAPIKVAKPVVKKNKYNLPTGVYRYSKGSQMKHGNDVLIIQKALSSIYFYPNKGGKNNGCDGWYGSDTANAVARFQSVNGLKVDGVYGDNTRKKLDQLVNKY